MGEGWVGPATAKRFGVKTGAGIKGWVDKWDEWRKNAENKKNKYTAVYLLSPIPCLLGVVHRL